MTAAGAIRQRSGRVARLVPARLRAGLNAALRMLADSARHAPGTWIYLFTLGVTPLSLVDAAPGLTDPLLFTESTNVHNLAHDPLRALVASAFWVGGTRLPWKVGVRFLLVMAPAERWLDPGRWLVPPNPTHHRPWVGCRGRLAFTGSSQPAFGVIRAARG